MRGCAQICFRKAETTEVAPICCLSDTVTCIAVNIVKYEYFKCVCPSFSDCGIVVKLLRAELCMVVSEDKTLLTERRQMGTSRDTNCEKVRK